MDLFETTGIEDTQTPRDTLLLVDYSSFIYRTLHVARMQGDKREDYEALFYHYTLNTILGSMKKFNIKASNTILCMDTKGKNWRSEVYPGFKADRKKNKKEDKFDWDEFFEIKENLDTILRENTKFKIIAKEGIEADDIIYEISKQGDTIVLSDDKDMKQVLRHPRTQLYMPRSKKHIDVSDFSETGMVKHILIGDKVDNIPSVKEETKFTEDFISFLKSENIFFEDVYGVRNLEIYEHIKSKFLETSDKPIFKKGLFGEKTAEKVLFAEGKELKEFLSDPLLKEHYKRNETLIDMEFIPQEIKDIINEAYSKIIIENKKLPMFGLQNWFVKNKLMALNKNIGKFLV